MWRDSEQWALGGPGATAVEPVGSTEHWVRSTNTACAQLRRRNAQCLNAFVEMSGPGSWLCHGAQCAEC